MVRLILSLSTILILVSPSLMAQLAVPQFFSDHMVLQRNRDAAIWGKASPDSQVEIEFKDRTYKAAAGERGNWKAKFPAGSADPKGADLTIRSFRKTIVIKDVLVGEVWLASGQSNMAFTMNRVPEYDEMLKTLELPTVRMFSAALQPSHRPRIDIAGKWHIPNAESSGELSAVAFWFAKKLHDDLDVPVGIIKTAWGGKPVETFTSIEALNSLPETKKLVDILNSQQKRYTPAAAKQLYEARVEKYKVALAAWQEEEKKRKAKEKVDQKDIAEAKRRPRKPVFPKQPIMTEGNPGVLFNGMIHPFVGYPIRGAIWYQGEANAKTGKVPYDVTLPLMIRDWRKRWGDDFAFNFVQLANFKQVATDPGNNDPWPLLQDRMRRILQTTPNTGMAVINDVGDASDIHPKDKKTPGERLARWALATTYGYNIAKSGPLYRSIKVAGSAINVQFDDVANGLKSRDDGPLKRFEIAGSDRVWHWADAQITDENTVKVSCKEVANPVAVRYAWAANPEGANLVNSDGLPTSVFRSDDWDDVNGTTAVVERKSLQPPKKKIPVK